MNIRQNQGSAIIIAIIVVFFTFVAYSFIQHSFKETVIKVDHTAAQSLLTRINQAIASYAQVKGQYPDTLETLAYPRDGSPAFIDGAAVNPSGFVFAYTNLRQNYELRLHPTSATGSFYFTDASGQIRVNTDQPADQTSDPI